jgi:4-hydroxysphinganine ceramide fatty acyl 2-hydroxylase
MYNFFVGWLIAYVAYEMVHWSVHHLNPKEGYLRNQKLYHMQHHYKFGTTGFGVSSKFWDVIFRTEIQQQDKKQK